MHGYADRIHEARSVSARTAGDGGVAARSGRTRARVTGRAGRAGAHRDAEDLRSAAGNSRGTAVQGCRPTRQAAALSDRGRRARPARPSDDGRAPSLPRYRRKRAEGTGLSPSLRGRGRARAHRGWLEETGRRLAAHAGGGRGGAGPPWAGGARPRRRRARRDPGLGVAAAPFAPTRPAGNRGHRPRLGKRDPPPREAVSLRPVPRPRPRRGRPARRGDRCRAFARPRAARARRRGQAGLPRPQEAGRALLRLRRADRARGLRRAHGLLLPRLPDRRPRAQGPAALEALEMSEIMQALYRGDDDTARELAKVAELDVFEAAALGDAARLR